MVQRRDQMATRPGPPHGPYHHESVPKEVAPSANVSLLWKKGTEGESFCPPGWVFSVYDAELQNHFTIPSQQVLATTGSLKYATYHERHGQGTRFRFQLCSKYSSKYSQGRCPDGAKCGYIHAIIDPTAIGKSIHINENLADCNTVQDVVNSQYRPLHNHNRYRLVQDGVLVAVHAPSANDEAPQLIYSGNLLRTHGGLQAYNAALASSTGGPTAKLIRTRHCAHFQFRRVCNLGEECNFVHSMAPYLQPKFRGLGDTPLAPPTPESRSPAYPQPATPPHTHSEEHLLPRQVPVVLGSSATAPAPLHAYWGQSMPHPCDQQQANAAVFVDPSATTSPHYRGADVVHLSQHPLGISTAPPPWLPQHRMLSPSQSSGFFVPFTPSSAADGAQCQLHPHFAPMYFGPPW